MIRDQVVFEPSLGRLAIKVKFDMAPGGYAYTMLDLKPDGTSYLEEYCAFLESCKPKPYCPQAITEIVEEEAAMFFAGDRSAQETAELIQRRVQLYFNEQG